MTLPSLALNTALFVRKAVHNLEISDDTGAAREALEKIPPEQEVSNRRGDLRKKKRTHLIGRARWRITARIFDYFD